MNWQFQSISFNTLIWRPAIIGSILCVALGGCSSEPKVEPKPPVVKTLKLVHQIGGTHYRGLVHNDQWYQTFDRNLLVMSLDSVVPIKTLELGPRGETGPAVDMVIDQAGNMFIVIEDDHVLRLSLEVPHSPKETARYSAAQLGIRPRRLSIVGGQVYVSGVGGVVRLADRRKFFDSPEDVGRVARGDAGLIACVGRRVIRLEDGRYLGSASDLALLTGSTSAVSDGALIFARQGEQGVLAGLMTPDIREMDAERATTALPGTWRSTRVIGDRLWIVTDSAVAGFRFSDGTLSDPIHVNVVGARDLVGVGTERLAIVGSFGRAFYNIKANQVGQGEAFWQVHREPSRLTLAVSDGRNILAGSNEGLWMYLINARAELTTQALAGVPPQPPTSAVVTGAQANIAEDRKSIVITSSGQPAGAGVPFVHAEEIGCLIHSVAPVDGEFWIGHDRGITVLRAGPLVKLGDDQKQSEEATLLPAYHVAGRLRLTGPVRYIYPLLVGGGASFVSEYGGFGVAEFVVE